jgi:hypothetical protein
MYALGITTISVEFHGAKSTPPFSEMARINLTSIILPAALLHSRNK